MAQITINIPDDKVARVRDAFAGEYGWSPDMGMNKTEFVRLQMINFIKRTIRNSEGNHQAGQARAAVESDIENIAIN